MPRASIGGVAGHEVPLLRAREDLRVDWRAVGLARGLVCLACLGGLAVAEPLSADDLARKNEDGYVTGLPLLAYSTDNGFGGGVRLYYYWNGAKTDPRFANTPYLQRIFVQAFVSSRGMQFHWIDYDAPKVLDSPYRLRSQLIFERDINHNYFGLGNAGMDKLRFPGSPKAFSSYSDYADAQHQIAADGTTFSKYDQYDFIRPIFLASVERLFLDDRVRVLGGIGLTYVKINDYTGKSVDATGPGGDTSATEAPTRLRTDCDAGKLVGCGGGRDDFLRFGISYDTRDFEPDPNRGVYLDAAVDAGTQALGSQFDYIRVLTAARGYVSPFDGTDLVFAGRALFEIQSAGTPFFSMNTLPFTEDPRAGLGGHRTLRGYRQDRFVGPVMTLLNGEVRWTFGHATWKNQKFGFILAPFLDVGRAYDSFDALTVHGWRPSYGGALRISWNLATIVTIDYGVSPEDTGFYVNFGHIF